MLPNPLASRWGRLMAFFFLYVTEGIPYGFATVAIVFQLRDEGYLEDEIGVFSGLILLPWSFKWVVGPFVDLLFSERFGPRRGWIVGCQILMAVTLLAYIPIDTSASLFALTVALTIHNCVSATQDVAIDALACGVLKSDERGLANGVMFAGAYVGQAIGGSTVLRLMGGIPGIPGLADGVAFETTFWIVAAGILLVTIFVSIPLKEVGLDTSLRRGGTLGEAAGEVGNYLVDAIRSFFANRTACLALIICLLPAGALFLGMQLHTALAKRLDFSREELADLTLVTSIVPAVFCVIGGYLSDRLGRRISLAVYILLTVVPTLWIASEIYFDLGWRNFGSDSARHPESIPESIKNMFWTGVVLHSAIQGLIYGTRIAMFMDIANPDVAATQFTAYMSLQNFVLSYTAMWQGFAITRFGYPIALLIDCGLGILAVFLLPFLKLNEVRKSTSSDETSTVNSAPTG